MPFGYQLGFQLGQVESPITADQALDLLVQLLPKGMAKWTGILSKTGDVYNLYAALAETFKVYCYDVIAQFRSEISALTTAAKLPDFESAYGIANTPTALTGTAAQRRAAVVSKMRESGASTIANIQAILAPLLGYANSSQLAIIECNRAALTALHTYANTTGASLGASGSVTQTVYVPDDGGVSDAGLQLQVKVTCTNPEQLSFVVTGPNQSSLVSAGTGQAVVTFPVGSLPSGSVTNVTFQLNDPSVCVGKKIFGNWSLQVTAGAAGCTLVSWSLFVEGGGARDAAGNSGLGEQMHDWVVQFNAGLSTAAPNFPAALAAIARIQPADSNPTLVQSLTAIASATLYSPFLAGNS